MATQKKQTPRIPYCAECGGTNVTTTAWVEWRADGTERPTNEEGPISDEEGNWCSDCDEHVEIIYPESMMTPRACQRRMANTAAREHGPSLAAALGAILRKVQGGTVTEDCREIIEASELLMKIEG